MALTIGPTGSAGSRRQQLGVHGAGLALGAATMALTLTLAGTALRGLPWPRTLLEELALGALALGWGARSALGVGIPYPRSRWQVPERWRDLLPPTFVAGIYGYLLGLGFLTDVVVPAYWLLAGLTVGMGSLPLALAAWLLYALTRTVMTGRTSRSVAACPVPTDGLPTARGLRASRVAAALLMGLFAAGVLQSALGSHLRWW